MATFRKQYYKAYSFAQFNEFLLKHNPDDISDVQFTIDEKKNEMIYSCVYLKEIKEEEKTDA